MSTWINGRESAALDVRDRGLNYGDGLFETMRVRGRRIRLLDYHLERLVDGCRRLCMTPPDVDRLRRELREIGTQRAEGVLKLIVTRGPGLRGYRPSGRERSTRIVTLHPLLRPALQRCAVPVRIRMCSTRMSSSAALAGLKTLNRLDSVLARCEWADARVWEGLMRDADDNIVCGTMSNIFVRQGDRLITPRLDRCGVAGVMRRWVLEQADLIGLDARESRLRWQDLADMDEAFMTNAVVGVVPVSVAAQGRERIRFAQHRSAAELRGRLDLH